ncbi:Hypothetical_protein [Hexamita inflata]|uniref:Hypothetical_protein n=1 Tax=Hexamita inflata TaxID=28002 RepID=A0ABP1I374_9EUKA
MFQILNYQRIIIYKLTCSCSKSLILDSYSRARPIQRCFRLRLLALLYLGGLSSNHVLLRLFHIRSYFTRTKWLRNVFPEETDYISDKIELINISHLTFVYSGSVSCSKPLRASKVCSFIQKKRLQKNESMLDSPVLYRIDKYKYNFQYFDVLHRFGRRFNSWSMHLFLLCKNNDNETIYIGQLFWYKQSKELKIKLNNNYRKLGLGWNNLIKIVKLIILITSRENFEVELKRRRN